MFLNRYFKTIIFLLFLTSCVSDPDIPGYISQKHSTNFALSLNEGNWGSDNASITLIDLESGSVDPYYYRSSNPGLRLGDLADDMVNMGDTVFVSVPGSSTIECFLASTGVQVGRILFNSGEQPRKIVIINDTLAYVTELTKNKVYGFNPEKLELNGIEIAVGPQPEGIAALGNYIFTANTAYGDLNAKDPNAKTISVIDINQNRELFKIEAGPNIVELAANANTGKLYALYYNLPSLTDSLGGIIEYDGTTFAKLREWRVDARSIQLDVISDKLYYLNYRSKSNGENNSGGISMIDLNRIDAEPQTLIQNHTGNIWYWLTIEPNDGTFWVSDAVDFSSDGSLLFYNSLKDTINSRSFKTGLNPTKIIFFKNR